MRKEQLNEILRLHKLFLRGGMGGVRADLRRANLRRADLSEADLSEAYLSEADLSEADLSEADLSEAYLIEADLINIKGKDIITYSRGAHQLIYVDGFVRVGCQYHSLDFWISEGEKIGREARYTEKQIHDYMSFIHYIKSDIKE